ncbi:MAG TPA: hypothetical protein VGZ25_13220 [Gemmataceae bacterium]|jgi:outer membrane lipoprotein-sorting protein|nr:hypothetical protein [Gemmataceae bacterium]
MRGAVTRILVIGAWLVPFSFLRADEQADAKAVIEKAIKAEGADKLAKLQGMNMKMNGKFYGMGDGIDYAGDWKVQLPDKTRNEITIDANGQKFTFIQIFNGDKGWISMNGEVSDANKDQIDEAKEELYDSQVTNLYPLLGKEFKLSPLGDSKVGDKEAVGVKVSSKGHRDISLFFDKKTSYLLKTETNVKDLMGGGGEVAQVTLYDDYKDVDGVKYPHKVVIDRDGKKFVDGEVKEVKLVEKVDDGAFAKP